MPVRNANEFYAGVLAVKQAIAERIVHLEEIENDRGTSSATSTVPNEQVSATKSDSMMCVEELDHMSVLDTF